MKNIIWPMPDSNSSRLDRNVTDNAITCSNVWQQAIDDELVDCFLGCTNDEVTLEYAKRKLAELIDWHVAVATDPAVNGGYELRKVGYDRKDEISLGDVLRDRST